MDLGRELEGFNYLNCFALSAPHSFCDYFHSDDNNTYIFDCHARPDPLINNPQHEHDDEFFFNIFLMYVEFPRYRSSFNPLETTKYYIIFKNASSKHDLQPHNLTDNLLSFTNYILSQQRNIVLPEAALADVEAEILDCAMTIVEEHDDSNVEGFTVAARVNYETGVYNNMYDDNSEDDDYRIVLEQLSLLAVGQRHGMVPASESSIQELKSVKIQQQEEQVGCTICIEDFEIDSDALSMPCSHLFHKECIITWLNNSNSCPVCRFKMPTRDI